MRCSHAVLALLDCLVEAQLLLLRDRVHHHLVVHRGADVALGAKVLAAVVVEVVVAAGQVGVKNVKVAGLCTSERWVNCVCWSCGGWKVFG